MPLGVITRQQAAAGAPAENSLIDLGQDGISDSNFNLRDAIAPDADPLGMGGAGVAGNAGMADPVWERLSRLPFFQKASADKQEELYFKELEREERRQKEEREREREEREREERKQREEREMNQMMMREDREFELRRFEIEQKSHQQSSGSSIPKVKVILPQWDDKCKIDKYLETCERLLTGAQMPQGLWVAHVLPLLPEKARSIYNSLPLEKANDYDILKRELLDHYAISPLVYRKNFFNWTKRDRQTYGEFLKSIEEQMKMWLHCVVPEGEEPDWRALLLRYRLDQVLPEEIHLHLVDREIKGVEECAAIADAYVLNRRVLHRAKGSTDNGGFFAKPRENPAQVKQTGANTAVKLPPAHSVKKEEPHYTPKTGPVSSTPRLFCDFCRKPGHTREKCWCNPDSNSYRPQFRNRINQQPSEGASAMLACESDQAKIHPLLQDYTGKIQIAGGAKQHLYLRDTGATLSFVSRDALPTGYEPQLTGEQVTVSGINRVRGSYPLCKVPVACSMFEGILTAALVDISPLPGVSVLLGNDVNLRHADLEFPCAVVTRSMVKAMPDALEKEDLHLDQMIAASEDSDAEDQEMTSEIAEAPEDGLERADTEPTSNLSPILPESQTLQGALVKPKPPLTDNSASLLKEQEVDPSLIPLWKMAHRPNEDHGYFVDETTKLLMYRVDPSLVPPYPDDAGNVQIVVPKCHRTKLIEWAHEHPAAGHVGSKKVIDRIKRYFTWPGIKRDVKEFCRGCGPCQRVGKGVKPHVVPLKSLPVVGKPFHLISADFVGPLAETTAGNKYLVTIIDHATKYMEAIPVPTADVHHAKDAFMEVFSRHGVPKQLLTDRGSVFTSRGFSLFLEELGIQLLLTSSYRPQSNGTVERAHGTLKRMLTACLETEISREWDKLLPWVLFAYRSSTHTSTGFTPFFLMYGREPTDILGLVSAQWRDESLDDVQISTADYVAHLRDKLRSALTAAEHRQRDQKDASASYYNRKNDVKSRRFKKGDLVLVQLPARGKPLVGDWQGPYPILEQVGKQTYLISTPDKRIKKRQMHVNAIRSWTTQPGREFAFPVQQGFGEGITLGDVMDNPPDPTELEVKLDPGNYRLTECVPDGTLPNLDHLSPNQRASIARVINQHPSLFSGPIGQFKGVEHDIDVESRPPIKQHYYRCAPAKLAIIKKEVDAMMELGVVRPSRSEWASPLILVKKPNNEWRPCVDYRQVNRITKGETYPLPRLDDLIDQVGQAPFITTLDLSKGYWQIPLTLRAQEISAFSTPFGQYEFLTMPFGLKLAPMTFQRAMNQLLEGLSDFAVAYLDDISIRSRTWEDHVTHLHVVFERLEQAGLTLNAKKCVIGSSSVKYLGYQVGSGVVTPVSAKVEAILNIPIPSTKTDIRSFLGSVGFYRRFIPRYSELAAPLTNLLKGGRRGDISLKWTSECTEAFEQLRAVLAKLPSLRAPDFNLPFDIYTDASEVGISAVLVQTHDEVPFPVAYYSRKLLDRESRYSTVEKELLAIMAALDHFHVYVGFGPITVHSDHRPLVWLRQCTTANQRVLRWALALSEYDLCVEHIKGSDNVLADMLSRQFPN